MTNPVKPTSYFHSLCLLSALLQHLMSRNSQLSQKLREWGSLVSLLIPLLFSVKEMKRGGSKDFKTTD